MATTFAEAILELTLACELERPELAVHTAQQRDILVLRDGRCRLQALP